MRRKIPLIILGGSDRNPAVLPPAGAGRHPLVGCKGLDVRLGERPLIEVLIERLEATGGFDPIWIAGPERLYREAGVAVPVIDTDGGFGDNIKASVEALVAAFPQQELAITTSDILPETAEFERLLEDYWQHAPSDLCFPIVRTEPSAALGASDWKPQYRILLHQDGETVTILPGHLAIFNPASLRLEFLYHLFDLAYRTRNRDLRYRRSFVLRQVLGGLLREDLSHILGLRLPTVTWDVVIHGVRGASRLRRGVATIRELEDRVRKMFVTRRHRSAFPDRRFRIPINDAMSLARDIDTVEEARAIGAIAHSNSAASS